MHKLPAVVDQVFRCDAMDKTLKDYIERAQKKIEKERKTPQTYNPNQYPVYPDPKTTDSDEKINPYGQH